MKILITGSNGRIGQKLSKKLSKQHDLILTSMEESPRSVLKNTKYSKADLTNINELETILSKENPEVVIHLAGIMGPICEENHDLADKINVEVTKTLALLSAKKGVRKFIFSSSASVYPQKLNRPLKEKDVDPQSHYGKTKLKAEKELEKIARNSDMQVLVLRLFNVYGEGFDDSLIIKLLNSTTNSKPLPLYDPSKFIRDYIHIDDVVGAYELATAYDDSRRYEVFNIGSGVASSTLDLVNLLRKRRVNFNVEVVKSNSNATHVVGDMTNTNNRFGFAASIRIEEFISSQEESR